jgi:hypothetical protein
MNLIFFFLDAFESVVDFVCDRLSKSAWAGSNVASRGRLCMRPMGFDATNRRR